MFSAGWHQYVLFGVVACLLSCTPRTLAALQDIADLSYGVPGVNATYDYVIVGGGTAGLTVARRLVEGGNSVAVVEAGSFYELNNGNISQIPAYATRGTTGDGREIFPLVDWGFFSTPQQGFNQRRIFYPQGKTLGGGSARNILVYQRGTREAYKRWADQVQDRSFEFDSIFPYFKRSPHFTPPNYSKLPQGTNISYDPNAFDRRGGPLQVSYSNYEQPFTRYLRRGFQSIGLQMINGFNSGKLLGFSTATFTINPSDEHRSSSETAFLRAPGNTKALTLYIQCMGKQIVFNQNKRATGVLVEANGKTFSLSASKEVIVAAGVFKTPQLLMLSGIGPRATMQNLGIPVVSELRGVGQNIWDHVFFGVGNRVNVTTFSALANATYANQATNDYINNQSGPLTNVGSDYIGWEKIPPKNRKTFTPATAQNLSWFPPDWPEIELLPVAAPTFPPPDPTGSYASFTVALVAPSSRGQVTINSTDANAPPLIDPRWLTAVADQQVVVQGFKRARELARGSGIVVGEEVFPGPGVQSDEQILEHVRGTGTTIWHAVGSCKMGPSSDPMAVVSTRGRVYGVQGLRVVDASIFPLLPPGHCQATVYMLAEKIAEDILLNRP